ncbi:MAG: tetratricopeptide repeat protein, partial [Chloroflexaceae bacterium]|nr:tetratricopeptide repeat protein [Chloroflexaceae bacterium]
ARPAGPAALVAPARREPQTAHTLSPGAGAAVLQEGRALLDAGRVDEVLETLKRVPLNGPHAPQTLALIARAHANRGDLDLAVAEARRAIELDALTTEAYILLGVLYARQGQVSTAARYLERARYLDPDSALISFYLADIYRQLSRTTVALREYRNTLRKLAGSAPDTLLDGVAVGWLRETCERYLEILARRL